MLPIDCDQMKPFETMEVLNARRHWLAGCFEFDLNPLPRIRQIFSACQFKFLSHAECIPADVCFVQVSRERVPDIFILIEEK